MRISHIGFLAVLALGLVSVVEGRTWTSSDCKTLEAEFVRSDGQTVTIRRSDGRSFTLELNKLSDGDQKYVQERKKAMEDGEEPLATASGEIRYPKHKETIHLKPGHIELEIKGRTREIPDGYVAMLFRTDLATDDSYPYGEYTKGNRSFEIVIYHDAADRGPYAVDLYALPEDAAVKFSAWYVKAASLAVAGRGKEIPPYDVELLVKARKLASATYIIKRED